MNPWPTSLRGHGQRQHQEALGASWHGSHDTYGSPTNEGGERPLHRISEITIPEYARTVQNPVGDQSAT